LRRLDLVVGPNGAGKTTFVTHFLASLLPSSHFVNADEIARGRWPDDPANHAYDAAQVAAETRAALIAAGASFIAETVFSHPSKLGLVSDAHRAGYHVVLHVLMVPEELAVARVRFRVRAGGHGVPEDKIRARHRRLWGNVRQAAAVAESATFYDNTRDEGTRIVAELFAGMATGAVHWPDWTPEVLRDLTNG
jgi:predicted ABC-type ATPase